VHVIPFALNLLLASAATTLTNVVAHHQGLLIDPATPALVRSMIVRGVTERSHRGVGPGGFGRSGLRALRLDAARRLAPNGGAVAVAPAFLRRPDPTSDPEGA